MTLAVAKALMETPDRASLSDTTVKCMVEIGRKYPNCGFGAGFYKWLHKKNPQPYNSFGNGAAMRVSPVAWVAESMRECIDLADAVTCVSHNHPEGMKGAEAVAVATYLAKNGESKQMIRGIISKKYYILDFTIDQIRPAYRFDSTCQGSVPQAIEAFLESENFEDAIRIAISLGGDSDTIAAIAGGIAEAYYSIPSDIFNRAMGYLPTDLRDILLKFYTCRLLRLIDPYAGYFGALSKGEAL
jgi:type I restriction enzyme M protein